MQTSMLLTLTICFIMTLIFTPISMKLAHKIGAVDQPNHRKMHDLQMTRLGGLAIVASFFIGLFLFVPTNAIPITLVAGAVMIILTGMMDDCFQMAAKWKLLGQFLAAVITVAGGIRIEFITFPVGEKIEFGIWAIPITIIWIIAITNAINLIDGLDGLSSGITSIALVTIIYLATTMGDITIALIATVLLGSTLGFLVFNFHPAKLFMGDTGSLFLGYMVSVLAVMGLYKNATVFSLMVPILILMIPILDTTIAIIRRIIHKQPISAPDKFHVHHCILRLGFTHRQAVLILYLLSALFSIAAVLFTKSTVWGAAIILIAVLILAEILIEVTGLLGTRYRPVIQWFQTVKSKRKRS